MKKYSILGLSLLAVSAVTAAFIPSKSNTGAFQQNGHLTQSTGNQADATCRRPVGDDAINCGWTATGVGVGFSSTSGINDANSVSFDELNFTGTLTTNPDNDAS